MGSAWWPNFVIGKTLLGCKVCGTKSKLPEEEKGGWWGGIRIISHSRYKILLAVLGFLVLMSNTILDTKISDGNNSTAKSKHLKSQLVPRVCDITLLDQNRSVGSPCPCCQVFGSKQVSWIPLSVMSRFWTKAGQLETFVGSIPEMHDLYLGPKILPARPWFLKGQCYALPLVGGLWPSCLKTYLVFVIYFMSKKSFQS